MTPTVLTATRFSPMKFLAQDMVLNMIVILVKSVDPAMTPKDICLLKDFTELKP